MAVDFAGRIVVAGSANNTFAVARYDADGRLDPSFGKGGKVTTSFGRGCVAVATGVAIDLAGRAVLGGSVRCNGHQSKFALARYRSDGRLAPSLGGDGRVTTAVGRADARAHDLAIDSAGRIVVAGAVGDQFAVARFTPGGKLDPQFGSNGVITTSFNFGISAAAYGVALDASGKILAAGSVCGCSHVEPSSTAGLARYTPDGAPDSSFGSNGRVMVPIGPYNGFSAVALDGAGNIVAGGQLNSDFFLARYTPTGAPDTAFGSNGQVTTKVGSGAYAAVGDLLIDPAGRIVAAGAADQCASPTRLGCYDFALARYDPNGSLDPTFGTGGTVTTNVKPGAADSANAVALDAAGDILAGGSSGNSFALASYTTGGALDPTFAAAGTIRTGFPPDTWISQAQIKPRRGFASFRFAAGARIRGFQCALATARHRTAGFGKCGSRSRETYRDLKPGRHLFEVRAVFPSGPDPTPARWRFRIRRGPG